MRKIFLFLFLVWSFNVYAKFGVSIGGGGGYPLSSFGDNTLLKLNDTSGIMVDYKNSVGYFGGADVLISILELGYRYHSFAFSEVKKSPSGKIIKVPNTEDPPPSLIEQRISEENKKIDKKDLTLQTIDAGIRFYIVELLIHPYVGAGTGLAIISALDEKSYGAHVYAGGGLDFKLAPFMFLGLQLRYNIAIMQKKTSLEESAAKIAEGANFEVKDFASYMNYVTGNIMFTIAF
ncbi:MAG: hypothetical protein N2746_12005 [Deltaproteobacteria bacterium]|nr:hypothetical protein [Deltaproteobacteria bacterium]